MRLEKNICLGGYPITQCEITYFNMATVPHKMVGLERILDYKGFRLQRCRITEVLDCRGVGL